MKVTEVSEVGLCVHVHHCKVTAVLKCIPTHWNLCMGSVLELVLNSALRMLCLIVLYTRKGSGTHILLWKGEFWTFWYCAIFRSQYHSTYERVHISQYKLKNLYGVCLGRSITLHKIFETGSVCSFYQTGSSKKSCQASNIVAHKFLVQEKT